MPESEKKEEIKAKPVAKFVKNDAPRIKKIDLEWPVEYDGKVYNHITLRRCTGGEITEYIEAINSGESTLAPVIDCPEEVYIALDDDDAFIVDKEMANFLPQRLLAQKELLVEQASEVSGKSSAK